MSGLRLGDLRIEQRAANAVELIAENMTMVAMGGRM